MSPAKSCDINGPRPSPLLINKDSRFIRKPSHSSSSFINPHPHHQHRQPVIIYTHSPKVIHTQPKDFMALVQRLTGFTPPNVDQGPFPPHPSQSLLVKKPSNNGNHDDDVGIFAGHNDNDSSSVLTEENCGGGNGSGGDLQASSSYGCPRLKEVHSNTFFTDFPLFTPRSTELFSSPRPVLRYSDAAFASPSLANSLSPSFVEFLKGLPEF